MRNGGHSQAFQPCFDNHRVAVGARVSPRMGVIACKNSDRRNLYFYCRKLITMSNFAVIFSQATGCFYTSFLVATIME